MSGTQKQQGHAANLNKIFKKNKINNTFIIFKKIWLNSKKNKLIFWFKINEFIKIFKVKILVVP